MYLTSLNLADLQMFLSLEHKPNVHKSNHFQHKSFTCLTSCLQKSYMEVDEKSRAGWPQEAAAAATAKSLQSCPTLCDPIDSSPRASPVPGVLQARTLEWVATAFSNAWKWKVKVKSLSLVRLLVTPWTAAHQAPPSMGFSRQEYWSGVPLPSLPQEATDV